MWIFGYGSLTWKAEFPYEQKLVGYVKGYVRRFYQKSTDHRGTPEKPGRVVTLIPTEEKDVVYGVAYKIRETDEEDVLTQLDYREKDGYERVCTTFFPRDPNFEPIEILIYIAHYNNENYGGVADVDSIASQIYRSIGPSGPNIEYVCKLAEVMRTIAPEVNDEHLFLIEKKVLELTQCNENKQY